MSTIYWLLCAKYYAEGCPYFFLIFSKIIYGRHYLQYTAKEWLGEVKYFTHWHIVNKTEFKARLPELIIYDFSTVPSTFCDVAEGISNR